MTERNIRDLHTARAIPPLFCKVIVDGKSIVLETRDREQNLISIYWEDLLYQVKLAIEDEKRTLSRIQ